MQIAVLAVQGAFIEHEYMLSRLGVESFELRQKSDLDKPFDGLIIPGGESTVQGKLIRELDMFDILKSRISDGLPVFGTCAGLILLAKLDKMLEIEKNSSTGVYAILSATIIGSIISINTLLGADAKLAPAEIIAS